MVIKIDVKDKPEIKKVYVNSNNIKSDMIFPHWWECDDESIHTKVWPYVAALVHDQGERFKRSVFNAQLYEAEDFKSISLEYMRAKNSKANNKISLNVTKSGIDTLVSKIGTIKPKPYFLTRKGKWEERKKAQRLSDYIEGCFQTEGVYAKGRNAFRDGAVWGSGFIKVIPCSESGRVKYKRVRESDIIVDQVETLYGSPKSLHEICHISRYELKKAFPEAAKFLDACESSITTGSAKYNDMIKVIESWRLPVGKEPGKRSLCVQNRTLLTEEWKDDSFPFAKFNFSEPLLGYFGRGAPDQVRGIQLEINKLIRTTALAMHRVAVPRYWLSAENRGYVTRINNDPGSLNYYKGDRPYVDSGTAMSPEVYRQIDSLYYRGLEILGVSQLSSGGKPIPGIDSGRALRTMQQIESERFREVQQAYQEFYLELAKLTISATRQLSETLKADGKSLQVKVGSGDSMEVIDWKDAELSVDNYILQLWPTNLLRESPEGKTEDLTGLLQAGIINQEEAMSGLDFPDLKSIVSVRTAGRDLVLKTLDSIMDGSDKLKADSSMNLSYASAMSQLYYLRAKADGAPDTVLDSLLAFREDVDALVQRAEEERKRQALEAMAAQNAVAQGQVGPSPQLPPTARPMPNPESDIRQLATEVAAAAQQ